MINPIQYRNSIAAQEVITKSILIAHNARDNETSRLKYDVYQPRIRAIEDECSTAVNQVVKDHDTFVAGLQEKNVELLVGIKEVEQTLDLIDVAQEKTDLNFSVYYYSDRDEESNLILDKRRVEFKPFAVHADNQYKRIYAFIVPNRKPVKKFTLFLAGHSIFSNYNKQIISNMSYGYINGICEENANIRVAVCSAATEKELVKWYEKRKADILQPYLEKHAAIEKKYEEAKDLYFKSFDWQILYLEYKKHYYEHHYSHGIETPEYAAIVKKLNQLKK